MSLRNDLVAEIDLSRLRHNVRNLREHSAPADIIGVVKANAYGHGVIPVSRVLLEEGVAMLALATVDEAIELREAGINAPLLLLGKVWPHQLEAVFQYNLEPLIASDDDYNQISGACTSRQQSLNIHMKIDTGMGRLGFLYTNWESAFRRVMDHPGLQIKSIISHFATAEEPENPHAETQRERFETIYRRVRELTPAEPPRFHLANSAGTLYRPESRFDMVRLGISLYGIPPANHREQPFQLQQVMTLRSQVAYVKHLPGGYPVGYGSTYHTREESTILVCSGGYEDGIPKRYGNAGEVLIHGRRFPIVGVVSMDTFMVDVRKEAVEVGEEVILLGEQGEESISVWEIAEKTGLIPYEVICGISDRVSRKFHNEPPVNE